MISETKIDASFRIGQFLWNGFSTPVQLDRNAHGGGILLYVRENSDQSFTNFINTCNTVLDKQLPKKRKYVRGNQSLFMNKTLS